MARPARDLEILASRLRSLPEPERLKVIRAALTPQIRRRLDLAVIDDLRARSTFRSAGEASRAIGAAVRELRREPRARRV